MVTYTGIIQPSVIRPRNSHDAATRTVSENDILSIYCFLIHNWKYHVKVECHHWVAYEVITWLHPESRYNHLGPKLAQRTTPIQFSIQPWLFRNHLLLLHCSVHDLISKMQISSLQNLLVTKSSQKTDINAFNTKLYNKVFMLCILGLDRL